MGNLKFKPGDDDNETNKINNSDIDSAECGTPRNLIDLQVRELTQGLQVMFQDSIDDKKCSPNLNNTMAAYQSASTNNKANSRNIPITKEFSFNSDFHKNQT